MGFTIAINTLLMILVGVVDYWTDVKLLYCVIMIVCVIVSVFYMIVMIKLGLFLEKLFK